MIENKYFNEEAKQVDVHARITKAQNEQVIKKKRPVAEDMNYPTYSRGHDPPPAMDTYMYNTHLADSQGQDDGDAQQKVRLRPMVMSPQRMMYEQKFEKHVMEKCKKDIDERDNPAVEDPQFDLSCIDFANSLNSKAIKAREDAVLNKKREIEEMMMGGHQSHAVPGHEEIMEQRLNDEGVIDASEEIMNVIKALFDQVTMDGTTADCNTIGSHLRHSHDTAKFLQMCGREPKGVS